MGVYALYCKDEMNTREAIQMRVAVGGDYIQEQFE